MIIIKSKKFLTTALLAAYFTAVFSLTGVQAADIEGQGRGYLYFESEKNDVNVLDNQNSEISLFSEDSLPVSYNSDPTDLEYVSAIQNQGSSGLCWSYSANSCMESKLMKKDGVAKLNEDNKDNYDLSEAHMDLAMSNYALSPSSHGLTRNVFDGAGNQYMAISYMTRDRNEDINLYNGGVYEKDVPMPESMTSSVYTDETASTLLKAKATDFMPSATENLSFYEIKLTDAQRNARNEIIKQAVYNNGAANLSISCGGLEGEQYEGFKSKNGYWLFYRNNPNEIPNHAVTVVGWDDNFPKENFSPYNYDTSSSTYESTPVHNGAFIVKNSWGSQWGNNGYFYMSYDSNIQEVNAISDIIPRDFYDHIYDSAPYFAGGFTSYEIGEASDDGKYTVELASILERDTSRGSEKIDRIGVYIGTSDIDIVLKCDTDITGSSDDERIDEFKNLTPVSVKTINDDTVRNGDKMHIKKSGYYIFELEEPIELTGSNFILSYEITSPQKKISLPVEGNIADFANVETGNSYAFEPAENTIFTLRDDPVLRAYMVNGDVTVNVDGKQIKVPYGEKLSYDKRLYEKTAQNTYTEFDKNLAITEEKTLFTAENIGIADAVLRYQNSEDANGAYKGTRIVGEIAKLPGEKIISVKEIGLKAYDGSGESVDLDGKDPYIFTEIYDRLDQYDKVSEDNYIFKSPVFDKSNVAKAMVYAVFVLDDNSVVTVNYGTGNIS